MSTVASIIVEWKKFGKNRTEAIARPIERKGYSKRGGQELNGHSGSAPETSRTTRVVRQKHLLLSGPDKLRLNFGLRCDQCGWRKPGTRHLHKNPGSSEA